MMIARSPKRLVVIAGAGPAGLAAALWADRLGIRPLLMEAEDRPGGQLLSYSLPVVDLPGFQAAPASALIDTLVQQLRDLDAEPHLGMSVVDWDGTEIRLGDPLLTIKADWFFYAPGLRPRVLHIPGRKWISTESVSEIIEGPPGTVLVVGAGDRAVEGAIRLSEHGHQVTLLCRSEELRARREFRERLLSTSVHVARNTRLIRIEESGRGRRAWIEGSDGVQEWEGERVLVRIGMEPRVLPSLAAVHDGVAYPQRLRMSIVGDAALPVPDRSLVAAMASSMRAVKAALHQLGEL